MMKSTEWYDGELSLNLSSRIDEGMLERDTPLASTFFFPDALFVEVILENIIQ